MEIRKRKKRIKHGEPRTNILQNVKDVSRANILKKKKKDARSKKGIIGNIG